MVTHLEQAMETTYPRPDGPEQRTAELEERFALDAEFDTLLTDEVQLSDKERIEELKALLADIHMGAEMMLAPALNVTGAMRGYVSEVKRVSSAGRTI